MRQKVALITGASSGIGKAIYEYLKEKNWKVVGVSRRGPDIHDNFEAGVCLEELTFKIDLFVHAAGIMPLPEEVHMSTSIMNVNFWSCVILTRHLLKNQYLVSGGCVINIGSISANRPDPDLPIYAASKAALIAYTKSMALKHADEDIRFNIINPGFYNTNLVPADLPETLLRTIPMGYEEDPANLAPLVEMIYNCNYMTGTEINVDGGVSL